MSIAEQGHRDKGTLAALVISDVSYLQVSKPDSNAVSTWILLAKLSPSSLQASLASVKFSCGSIFFCTRATPIILHDIATSSVKKSLGPYLAALCSQASGCSCLWRNTVWMQQ